LFLSVCCHDIILCFKLMGNKNSARKNCTKDLGAAKKWQRLKEVFTLTAQKMAITIAH
jgi:hypothetical protein